MQEGILCLQSRADKGKYRPNFKVDNAGFINKISTYFKGKKSHKNVDIVENLLTKQGFADFQYISGSHSYQQVTVDTII